MGLPGTNGFVGEFLVLIGAFNSTVEHAQIYATIAMLGVILGAVYLLWMYQRVAFGEIKNEKNKSLKDLSLREYALLVPFILLIFWLGVYPKSLTDKTEATMQKNLKSYRSAVEQAKTKSAEAEKNKNVLNLQVK